MSKLLYADNFPITNIQLLVTQTIPDTVFNLSNIFKYEFNNL